MVMAVLIGATIGVIGGEVTLLGIVALPQMLRLGYDRKLAIGTICAGGALGSMIPPSIILVFFGLAANISIGDLLLASVVPGLMLSGSTALHPRSAAASIRGWGRRRRQHERDDPARREAAS